MTECQIEDTNDVGYAAQLVRGCQFTNLHADAFSDARCVVGNTINRLGNVSATTYVEAFTVQYVGAGATATLELSGGSDANTRTCTAKVDGSSVGTFAVARDDAA
ncbi:hypothetical protein B2G71_22215 [Novosphingobium sp. PC22D]|nr:hypothetical protein B2G71_22215 [Novosphingobium sp. PC22D]